MLATEFCPHCGAPRVEWAKFCGKCGNAYEGPPRNEAPTTPASRPAMTHIAALAVAPVEPERSNDNPAASFAGIAWIICAALTGYLALLQYGTAQNLQSIGLNAGNLQTYAIWNGVSAVLTIYFGVRLLQRPSRGFLDASTVWGVLSVLVGVLQIGSGATNDIFLGSIAAAGVAGVLSYAARSSAPEAATAPTPGPESALPTSAEVPRVPVTQPATPELSTVVPPVATGVTLAPNVPSDAPSTTAGSAPATLAHGSRRQPVLILGGLAVAVVAIAVVGFQVLRTAPSVASASPTPPALSTARPTLTPKPTLFDLAPGSIAFDKPSYKVGTTIGYTVTLNQDPDGASLELEVSSKGQNTATSSIGVTSQIFTSTATLTGAAPGTYLFQVLGDGRILAQGTVKLTK